MKSQFYKVHCIDVARRQKHQPTQLNSGSAHSWPKFICCRCFCLRSETVVISVAGLILLVVLKFLSHCLLMISSCSEGGCAWKGVDSSGVKTAPFLMPPFKVLNDFSCHLILPQYNIGPFVSMSFTWCDAFRFLENLSKLTPFLVCFSEML